MAIVAKEIWSDIHQDIKVDAQGSIKKVINIEAVKTSIDNILRTSKGTRVMLRDFGSDLRGLLFENIDDDLVDLIADEIKTAINTWDSRVLVNAVNFKSNADRNQVTIGLKFAIKGYDEIFSMSLNI
ncbi:MAG: GPW/gp25 family protein [Candidatus Heimdallarchaeaceae archaeon]